MFTTPEQFSSTTKALFGSQLSSFNALTSKTIEVMEKLTVLNLSAVKASAEDVSGTTKQLLSVKDPQEFVALVTAQPAVENATLYQRHLTEILSGIQNEFAQVAESQIAETQSKVAALIEDVSKNAPAGSENAVSLLKSAIQNANASYEQVTKAGKQLVETLEKQVSTASEQFAQATAKKPAKASKK